MLWTTWNVVKVHLREDTLQRRKRETLTLSSLLLDLKFNTHLRLLLIFQELVLYPCHVWKLMSVNLMNTRNPYSHQNAPSVSPWKPVLVDSGTNMHPRL